MIHPHIIIEISQMSQFMAIVWERSWSTWINLDQLDQAAHFEVPHFPTNPHIEYQKSWFRCPESWTREEIASRGLGVYVRFPKHGWFSNRDGHWHKLRIGHGTSAKTTGILWTTGWACWIMNVLWPQSLSLSLYLSLSLSLSLPPALVLSPCIIYLSIHLFIVSSIFFHLSIDPSIYVI